jgi:hypothetical protein
VSKRNERWIPTDHACRECGGRVVQITNSGPTGGGNPVWRCADCGIGSAAMGPNCICWCGFQHRGQAGPAYRCVHVDRRANDPIIAEALLREGYLAIDPRRRPKNEIAVIPERTIDLVRLRTTERATP